MKKIIFLSSMVCLLFTVIFSGCKHNKQNINSDEAGKSEFKLNRTVLDMQVGTVETLTVLVQGNVLWETSDKNVAVVDTKGRVKAKSIGTAVITASLNEKKASCTVTVGDLSLDSSSLKVAAGKTRQIEATVKVPEGADKTVTWSSENPDIASVAGGVVTGVSAGETEIVAKNGGRTAKCTVTVTEAVNCTLTVEISNIRPANADIKIIPSDNTATYAFSVQNKKGYEKALERKGYKNAFELDRGWYEFLRQSYNLETWQEAAKRTGNYYKTGEQSTDILSIFKVDGGIGSLQPDTDFILYAYLIKEDGDEPEDEIIVREFRTSPPFVSQNNITANITNRYSDGVDVDFTVTDENETYIVNFQRPSFVDFYKDSTEFTFYDMAYNILSSYYSNDEERPLFKGTRQITPKDVSVRNKTGNVEYYLIYFSYDTDNGVCSEPKVQKFTTGSTPKP